MSCIILQIEKSCQEVKFSFFSNILLKNIGFFDLITIFTAQLLNN